jgi:hypothetical protein
MRSFAVCGAIVLVTLASAAAQRRETLPRDNGAVRPIEPGSVSLADPRSSANDRHFSFIVYGDTRGPADGQIVQPQHRDVVERMLEVIDEQRASGSPVRFVVQSGDAVNNGRFSDQWNRSFTPLIEHLIQKGRVPYFFAVGNHDVTSAAERHDEGRRLGLANTAAAMAKLWPPEGTSGRMAGYPTYSFAYGPMFFIVLDSNIGNDPEQLQWVSSQLDSIDPVRYPIIAAVFHHPPITSGEHGGPTTEPQSKVIRERYMPLFRRHHVRLLLTGHDHLFDHYVERYSDDSGPHRIDHLVSGGGGGPIYTYTGEPDLDAYVRSARPQVVTIDHTVRPGRSQGENPHHFVLMEVTGDRLRMKVVPTVAAPFTPWGVDTIWLDEATPAAPSRTAAR